MNLSILIYKILFTCKLQVIALRPQ